MSSTDREGSFAKSLESGTFKTRWFNPRRKRFWVIFVVFLYGVLGFFAVPQIIKSSVIELVGKDLGRTLHIKVSAINPFALSFRVRQLELQDTDGVKLAAFDDFYINFELSSLFHWAWTFQEVRLINPYVYYERFDAVDSRFSRLLADAEKKWPAEKSDDESTSGVIRLLIHDLKLTEGLVVFKDHVPATPVEIPLGPINIAIKELNTLPDHYGEQQVAITLPDDARLQWQGNLALAPLDLKGKVQLENANLAVITPYLKSLLPLKSFTARLSSRFKYHVREDEGGKLQLDIDQMELALGEVAVSGLEQGANSGPGKSVNSELGNSTEFFNLQKLAMEGGSLRYPGQRLVFERLHIDAPELSVWKNPEGLLSLSQLIPAASQNESKDAPEIASKPWQLGLNELVLERGKLNFSDWSIEPHAQLDIANFQVNATNISNQDNAKIPLQLAAQFIQGGEFSLDAELVVLPELSFSGATKTRGIPLSLAQPYVQKFSRILVERGTLDSDFAVVMPVGKSVTVSGAVTVPDLEIKDAIEGKRLLAWNKLRVEDIALDLGAGKLTMSPLQFDQPFGRIIIYRDQTTNLSGLVIEKDTAEQQPQAEASKAFDVVINGVKIEQGGMDFSDLSLPLPFATYIKNLNGSISTIATASSEPATIKLEGQVDEFGLSRINGDINLLDPLHHTAVSVEFRNLLMSSLSPYTVQFAGRKIDEGRLNLDLRYDINKSQLQANNKLVISDLQLGDEVAHPDAASLPLGLAVALLKDGNGVIDISLPIEGDINDPEFGIGGIIWQAFAGLIVKAVTAPFRLLGSLIGVDSDEFGQFQFLAGRADLTPPELEKVAQLKQALLQRPKLNIEIKGGVDPAIDTPALKYKGLVELIKERLGDDELVQNDDINMLDDRLRRTLEKLFKERYPDTPLKTVKADNKTPPTEDTEGQPVLDELAYSADLRDRLLEAIVISEAELAMLAQSRAETIQAVFLLDEFDATRVLIVDAENVESEDGQWVKLELGVTAK